MKLTVEQAEAKLTAVWGCQAFVLTHRICGNRYVHAATDHHHHWMPLQSSWIRGRHLFESLDGPWPELTPMTWEEPVLIASQRALAHFVEQGNPHHPSSSVLQRPSRESRITESPNPDVPWRRQTSK